MGLSLFFDFFGFLFLDLFLFFSSRSKFGGNGEEKECTEEKKRQEKKSRRKERRLPFRVSPPAFSFCFLWPAFSLFSLCVSPLRKFENPDEEVQGNADSETRPMSAFSGLLSHTVLCVWLATLLVVFAFF